MDAKFDTNVVSAEQYNFVLNGLDWHTQALIVDGLDWDNNYNNRRYHNAKKDIIYATTYDKDKDMFTVSFLKDETSKYDMYLGYALNARERSKIEDGAPKFPNRDYAKEVKHYSERGERAGAFIW